MIEPAAVSKIHLGIYGVAVRQGKIFLIQKGRGPYKGLFDLPGGRIEPGENLAEVIRREFMEETGLKVLRTELLDVAEYHCTWNDDGEEKAFHHVALYYRVDVGEGEPRTDADGHDSVGALWLATPLSREIIAPIAHKVLNKLHLILSS